MTSAFRHYSLSNFYANRRLRLFAFSLLSIGLLISSLLFSSVAQAADIRVRIDRTQVEVNETFTLTFESSEAVDDDPDFSPLENDFQILNQSTSSNISIINGQYTRSQRWNVTLMALREGRMTIPSINFGSDVSPPYQITIQSVKQSSDGSGAELISELVVSTNSSYPQSQILVTQRLLSRKNITAYEFSKLKFSGVDASIEALGDAKQYQTKRGDVPYLVLEQHYALFPQQPGTLTIEPSIASARIALNSARDPYDPFRSNTKTVRRASEKQSITIKPIPTSFKGSHWLVANEVQLVEEFPEGSTFKVGEPITRTLSILVDGQSTSQLPEFVIDDIDGLKQYPDQPLSNNNISDTGITGVQQVKVAIIPSRAGTFTLPEIRVPWWNLKSGKMEVAKIQQRSFTVGAAPASSTAPAPSQPATVITEASDITTQPQLITENVPDTQIESATDNTTSNILWKLLALLFFIAWLVTLFLLWKQKRTHAQTETATKQQTPSLNNSHKQLQSACENNDAQACKVALLYWANALFKDEPVYSLGELSSRVDESLGEQIKQLNTLLYKNQPEQWQCNGLADACELFAESYQASANGQDDEDKLEPLYK